ncbi:mast cell protease 1A-like [Emydura macquarii macquarii]|uniref:mast cell protease 1A-like n=1 Tax=Emydura macquarii macquarii TaxID=1129001 RepID=UPI00352B01D5
MAADQRLRPIQHHLLLHLLQLVDGGVHAGPTPLGYAALRAQPDVVIGLLQGDESHQLAQLRAVRQLPWVREREKKQIRISNIFVYLGVQDFMDPGQNWQLLRARRWVQHADFNNENLDNDIMGDALSHGAELSEWVGLVPLQEANHHVRLGSECSVAKWGWTSMNTTTDRLQEVEQEVVMDGLCRERYRHYNPSTMLCTGNANAKTAAFEGDSGGPLVCDGVVQGIVSNGDPSGWPPSVYTRISKFSPWINETLQKLS